MLHLRKRQGLKKSIQTINRIAEKKGIPAKEVALTIVNNRRPEIEKYVLQNGEQPKANPVELAVQAAVIHENKVEQAQKENNIPDYEVAEDKVFADEQADEDSGQAENFAPALLGAIVAGSKDAIEKINAKRKMAGKPPLLSGKKMKAVAAKLKGVKVSMDDRSVTAKVETPQRDDEEPKTDLGIAASEIVGKVKEHETNQWIKDHAVLLLLIAAGIFLLGKNS